MLSLIIDTSSDDQLIALRDEEILLQQCITSSALQSSKEILPNILNILKLENLTLKELDLIAVGIGPGSFVGTRCGVMVAKSLAFALEIPIQPFFSHALYAEKGFFTASDAKSGKIYFSQTDLPPTMIDLDEMPLHQPTISPACQNIAGTKPLRPDPLKVQISNKYFTTPHQVEVLYLKNLA